MTGESQGGRGGGEGRERGRAKGVRWRRSAIVRNTRSKNAENYVQMFVI